MGIFNLFGKNSKKPTRVIDHIDDEGLKEKIKSMSVDLIRKDGNEVNDNSRITIDFKYLQNVENSGLHSMYIVEVDGRPFYFSIEKDNIELLDEKALKYFNFSDDEDE